MRARLARATRAELDRSLHAIVPNAEPAPPKAPPAGPQEFNTEYYLGSAEAKSARFVDFGKYLEDESETQDFLMTHTPTPVGKTAEELMKLAHANLSECIAGVSSWWAIP